MRDIIDNDLSTGNNEESSFNYKVIMFTVLNNWYWFVLSIALMIAGAWIHLRYAVPTYMVNSSVLINDESSNSGIDMESLGLLRSSRGGISSTVNKINSEIVVMKSRDMIEEAVLEIGLNISYFALGRMNNVELYNSSPIVVSIPVEEQKALSSVIKLQFKKSSDGGLDMIHCIGGDEEIVYKIASLPTSIKTTKGIINLSAPDFVSFETWGDGVIEVTIMNPKVVAGGYRGALTISSNPVTPGIIRLALVTTNRHRGIDFVNTLVDIYNRKTTAAKNEMVTNTTAFIAERLAIIDVELSSTEMEIENFKREAGTISIEGEAQYTYTKNKAYEEMLIEIASQQRLLSFFKEHVLDSKNKNSALPINIGVEDGGLSSLVTEYNAQLAERKRIALISSEKNPAMVTFDSNLEALYQSILTVINSAERNLELRQAEVKREAAKYDELLQNAPAQEREFLSITRQQGIKASLYLHLLQKREENALMAASTTNTARIVEETSSGGAPLSPNKNQIYMIALIFGLVIPAVVIYLVNFLRFKIEGSRDIERITKVPIVGAIPFLKELPSDKNSIVVIENQNDMMAEGFRDLRTNLLYMLPAGKKVILVTSTHASEGKSYTAVNLSISMALMGKRVVLVGLDIRKPGLNAILGTSSKQRGISSYLSGQTTDLMSLVEEMQPNFHVLYGGAIPPNPTELLSRETLPAALEILKANFDYVIVDTAPVGVVTDTYQFSKHADLSLYVCRANVTSKSDYELINTVAQSEKLPNLCTSVVGVDTSKRRYGYGYGGRYGYGGKYGYKYGGYKYKYGYSYGEDGNAKSSKRKK